MMVRFYLTLCCLGALLSGACDRAKPLLQVEETRRHMGVPWTITAYVPSRSQAAAAIAAAHDEVARLERILSDYDPASELSRLAAAAPTPEPVRVSDDLWRVLSRAVAFRDASGGGFDPAVGPLTTLWRQARRTGRLPAADRLAAARAATGRDALVLHPESQAVSLTREAMRLDLGGIGMGDAIDRAIDTLRRRGIEIAMVDASGDIAVCGAPPGQAGWRIAMAPLGSLTTADAARLVLVDAAVTTSGDAFQAVTIDGIRYGHVVDPRTGLGITGPAAVTVIAPDCTTADALATAALVLGRDEGLRLVASLPGCSARFVWKDEAGALREAISARWPMQSSQTAR